MYLVPYDQEIWLIVTNVDGRYSLLKEQWTLPNRQRPSSSIRNMMHTTIYPGTAL